MHFLLVRDTERHLAAGCDLNTAPTNLDVRLQPALTLSVKVQDSAGKPVPAATVNLNVASKNGGFNQGFASTSDQGVVEFRDLPQEQHYRAFVSAKGFGNTNIEAQPGQTKTNRFDFPVWCSRGRITNSPGRCWGLTANRFPKSM